MIINPEITHIHDKGYKEFFKNKLAMLDLVKTKLNVQWADLLKPEDLTLISEQNHDEDLKRRDDDIMYKATIEGQDIIFYVMLELQSTIDYTMAFRMYQYMYLQHHQYFKNGGYTKHKNFIKLPVIIPIVLYNGYPPWDAITEFKDCYYNSELFGGGILNFEYVILDIKNNYSKETLLKNLNLTSALFLLDQGSELVELEYRALEVAPTFQLWPKSIQTILTTWIENTAPKEVATPLCKILESNKEEALNVVSNISRTVDEIKKNELIGVIINSIGVLDDQTISQITKLPIDVVRNVIEEYTQDQSKNKIN